MSGLESESHKSESHESVATRARVSRAHWTRERTLSRAQFIEAHPTRAHSTPNSARLAKNSKDAFSGTQLFQNFSNLILRIRPGVLFEVDA